MFEAGTIQAIETKYQGYRMRSRIEARYAVAFDTDGIPWDYETEGYVLPSGDCYLPDYWLPRISMFAEVKKGAFSEDERRKCAELCQVTGWPVILLDGMPRTGSYEYFYLHEGEALLGDYDLGLTLVAVEAARFERFGR